MFTPLPVNHWSLRPDGLPHGQIGAGRLPNNWPADLPIDGWGDAFPFDKTLTVNGNFHYFKTDRSSARIDATGHFANMSILNGVDAELTPDGYWGHNNPGSNKSGTFRVPTNATPNVGPFGNDVRYCSQLHMQSRLKIDCVNLNVSVSGILRAFIKADVTGGSPINVNITASTGELSLTMSDGGGQFYNQNLGNISNIHREFLIGFSAYREGSNVRQIVRVDGVTVRNRVVTYATVSTTADLTNIYAQSFLRSRYDSSSTYYNVKLKDVIGFSLI